MDLQKCIPENKYDTIAIEQASLIGFPALNPILSDLLVWVQDANWPVAAGTASLLSKAGPEIVPHIKAVLVSEDSIWKYWAIELVVRNLRPDVFSSLRNDIARLADRPSRGDQSEKVDLVAQGILSVRE